MIHFFILISAVKSPSQALDISLQIVKSAVRIERKVHTRVVYKALCEEENGDAESAHGKVVAGIVADHNTLVGADAKLAKKLVEVGGIRLAGAAVHYR